MVQGLERIALRSGRPGYTLVEVLVAVAIIIMLAGLVLSAIVAGKEGAKVSVDVSNLRQLGQAAALYASENDEEPPLSVRPLIASGTVTSEITQSPSDSTQEGMLARFIRDVTLASKEIRGPIPRATYIGPSDALWDWSTFSRRILPGRNPGWLVNLVRCNRKFGRVTGSTGPYLRLLMDGSVQHRTAGSVSIFDSGQSVGRGVVFGMYFCDENGQWFEEHR